MRQIPKSALDLIKRYESLKLRAYVCPAGKPTIGWGHTSGVTMADVKSGRTITEAQAEQLLRDDLAEAVDAVEDLIDVDLDDGQFGALVSFTFNAGAGALMGSTLRKKLNAGNYADVPFELMRWHHADGKDIAGLYARRAAECVLWRGGEIGTVEAVKPIAEAVAVIAANVQNVTRCDPARAMTGGTLPETVAQVAASIAKGDIVQAILPYLDGELAEIGTDLYPVVSAALERAVEYWKLPEATLGLFPN